MGLKEKAKTATSAAAAIAVALAAAVPSLEAQAEKKPAMQFYSVIEDSTGKYFVGDSTQYIVVRDSAGNEIGVKPVGYRPQLPEGVEEEREVFRIIQENGESGGPYKKVVVKLPNDSPTDSCRYLAFNRPKKLSPTGGLQKIPDLDKLTIMVAGTVQDQVTDMGLNLNNTEQGDSIAPNTRQYLDLLLQHAERNNWRQPATRYQGDR